MSVKAHTDWRGIGLGGSRSRQGMPAFHEEMSAADSDALHAYLIEQAWKLYEKPQPGLDRMKMRN